MALTKPYGSDREPTVYHDQIGCPRGNAIPKDERAYDTAGRSRCPTCASLMRDEQGGRD